MMEHHGGQVARRKGTAVAQRQVPWIMNASVKDNILFGKPFQKDAYENVLDVCCLRDDLTQLKDGDETEIGERGINLSGGQKARISLARVVYSDADIVFLDDPLSAVDANVGNMLFERCILGALATKTCIFVTHHTHVLPRCDRTVVLKAASPRAVVQGAATEGIDLIQEADSSEETVAETLPTRSRRRRGAQIEIKEREGSAGHGRRSRDGRSRVGALSSVREGRRTAAVQPGDHLNVARAGVGGSRRVLGGPLGSGRGAGGPAVEPETGVLLASLRVLGAGGHFRLLWPQRIVQRAPAGRREEIARADAPTHLARSGAILRQTPRGASSIASPPTRPCWIRRCPASSARAPGRPPS